MIKYINALVLLVAMFVSSCSDGATDFTTQLLDRNSISQTAGFTWFDMKVQVYKPSLSIIEDIKAANKPEYSFYFFAAPSCSCDSLQDLFPNAVKVLDEVGINYANVKFIAMKNENADNPFKDNFLVNQMPEVFLVINGLPEYSIADTIRTRNYKSSVESVILEALINANR